MRENKLHTPDGFKDFLPEEMFFKTETERRIEAVFNSFGYCAVKSPTLEYMEVFEGKGSMKLKQMYKYVDHDGETLVLRSDMTPAIARIAATAFRAENMPVRLCYTVDSFRRNESFKGKAGEFTEAGVELIGVNSEEADGEVISLAIQSLLSAGLDEFVVHVGHSGFLWELLKEAEVASPEVLDAISKGDYVRLEGLIKSVNMDSKTAEIIDSIPFLIGDAGIIDKVKNIITNEKALESLSGLENIYSYVCDLNLEKYIRFDLAMTGQFDYYTGIFFKGYTHGMGFSILDGGRYNNLIAQFGKNLPSVGFAIKIDNLTAALTRHNKNGLFQQADTLLAYGEKGRAAALVTANELRKNGVLIENSLVGGDIDKNIAYAKNKCLGGVLYFHDAENVTIINVETDKKETVSVEQLLGGRL